MIMKKILITMLILFSIISCNEKQYDELTKNVENITNSIQKEKEEKTDRRNGVVIKVYDGDTLTLEGKVKLRLYGIDAPELKQKGGKFARELLYNKIYNKRIEYVPVSTDRYGRIVAKIYYKDEYINRYMLLNGGAWWYEEYAKNDNDLKTAFENARKNRTGIFNDWKIKNPSEYRKEQKNK